MTILREYAAQATQLALDSGSTRFDEVVSPDGVLRGPWRRLAAEAVDLSFDQLLRVDSEVSRFLLDDAVTFAPPGAEQTAWRLDPIPLVIDTEEWATIEKGLAQRAELLNAILVDLYGEKKLLAQRILPSTLVFGHQGFFRGAARRSAYDPRPLIIAAVDLGRTADGQWQVQADRLQAPSGIGFAMENRRVLSRILPRNYRSAELHRLAPFYQALRSAILQSAPDGVENPRVVVLSPGPMSETAYDQASIAGSLGFPLVEGSDLTMRDGAIWMRSLQQLERVDVIVRRVDADWSDPLELRSESQLGVTGLAEASRRGTVKIVNGLGSGVLENPALAPFMSQMCEALLGESLRLPSRPIYWAGNSDDRAQILDRLDELMIRAIDSPFTTEQASSDELREKILAAPHRFVAQEPQKLSVVPTLSGDRLVAQEVTLRTFTLRFGSSYRPMIGGLAMAHDGKSMTKSKDVWVLKSSVADPDQGFTDLLPNVGNRAPITMSPRVLDDLYWLGRYCERLEDTVRLLLVAHGLAGDFADRPYTSGGATLRVLTNVIGTLSPCTETDVETNLRSLMLDGRRSGSLMSIIWRLREIAMSLRDQVSPDLFRVFGAIDRAMQLAQDFAGSWQLGESAGRILTDALALQAVNSNMVRDAGWNLLAAGGALERSIQLCSLLGPTLSIRRGIDVDRDIHLAVLQASESAVTHQRRYRGFLRVANVLDLLILDTDNPRSLRFSVEQLRHHLSLLPDSSGSSRPERLVDALLEEINGVDVARLTAIDGEQRPNLAEFVASVQRQLRSLSEAINQVHLAAGPGPRQLESALVES